jgi:hypothetical protein
MIKESFSHSVIFGLSIIAASFGFATSVSRAMPMGSGGWYYLIFDGSPFHAFSCCFLLAKEALFGFGLVAVQRHVRL